MADQTVCVSHSHGQNLPRLVIHTLLECMAVLPEVLQLALDCSDLHRKLFRRQVTQYTRQVRTH